MLLNPAQRQSDLSAKVKSLENDVYRSISHIRPLYWAVRYHRNVRGEFLRFRENEGTNYLWDLYRVIDTCDHMVVEKSVQCGLSEMFIIQSHIEAAERGMSVMYVLPKYELRNRFVNNRIYKLHQRVPLYRRQIAAAKAKIHRTSLTHIGKGTLAYVGSNVESEFIEIPIDSAYVDEKDRCNLTHLLMLPDRLTASPYRYEREISNPTVEGFGIDERYTSSSRGEWRLKCPRCGEWFVPDFFRHVVAEKQANIFAPRDPQADPDPLSGGELRLIHDCGSPVDRLGPGEWVHAHPKRDWQGFRVSKLFARLSPKGTLRELYRTWLGAVGNDAKTQIFYNSDLGLPFSSKGARISRAVLNDCRREYEYPPRRVQSGRQRFLGVDVNASLHAVLRERVKSVDGVHSRLIGTWVLPGFSQLAAVMREWQPSCTVIDALPEIHKVLEFKREFSGVWSSRFQESATSLVKNESKKEVSLNRTALLDYVRQGFELQTLINPMRAEFLEEGQYYAHLMAPTRLLEPNEQHPEKSRFVWREGSKPDHFALAEAYCLQAGMIVPDHGIFEFYDDHAAAAQYHDKRSVTGSALDDSERQKIADMSRLTPEAAAVDILQRNTQRDSRRPTQTDVDEQAIRDTIEFMWSSQKYVDAELAAQMSGESAGQVVRILSIDGYVETRIAGQYHKRG